MADKGMVALGCGCLVYPEHEIGSRFVWCPNCDEWSTVEAHQRIVVLYTATSCDPPPQLGNPDFYTEQQQAQPYG